MTPERHVLQRVAVCCSVLQCSHYMMHATCAHVVGALQHAATQCNTLQHTATRCNTLQHAATHCNTLQHAATHVMHATCAHDF